MNGRVQADQVVGNDHGCTLKLTGGQGVSSIEAMDFAKHYQFTTSACGSAPLGIGHGDSINGSHRAIFIVRDSDG